MAEREFPMPPDEQMARDRELIEALDRHRPIGEAYLLSGEVPVIEQREPSVKPPPNAELVRDPTPLPPIPRPPRHVARRVGQVVLVLVVLGIGYLAFSFWQVWSTGRADEARTVDAIVVMGAAQYDGRPSPQLAARLDHVVELWSEGVAPLVVVTGGKQSGDRFTEAAASASYLEERGVPADAIVQEGAGTSTFESLAGARGLVGPAVRSVLIVTDPYHALRSKLTAEEVGFEAFVSSTPDSVVGGVAELRRELAEAAGVALGRIIGFERLSGLTD